ncbi:sucrase ferredoxin [Actinacidiphila sp. bgisy167]|uniref:sucrase ferredoxin n=1 Tax=Actinacidiphila sp. bgisy167 TaxID=3413797 RepID=UPI003D7359E6
MSTCTSASSSLAEPVAATAATARTWLLLEQPGPWGPKALTGSHLDPRVGRALERAAAGTGVRVGLIRRPGRHADRHDVLRRTAYVAHTVPGGAWVREAVVEDPGALLSLDFEALGLGDHRGFGTPYEGDPLALVCTNGRRDRCCALSGRPLAAELAASGSGEVWEVTHLGGHRFSPTMLVLPYGYAYGRVDVGLARRVLAAAREGLMVLEGCRGRSAWERPGQAAELAVRRLTGETRADALTVDSERGTRVRHLDGRVWDVEVTQVAAEPPRPESCGAALGAPLRMEISGIQPAVLTNSAV